MNNDLFAHAIHGKAYKFTSSLKFSQPQLTSDDDVYTSKLQEDDLTQFGDLQAQYEGLISSHVLTSLQNQVFLDIITRLVHGCECPSLLLSSLNFSFSDEEGVMIYRTSDQGISFIAIDNEGDSMFSFSPYKGEGERVFFDYGSGTEEAMAYRILAK